MISYRKQLLLFIVIVCICGIAFYNTSEEIKKGTLQELNYRQTVHARQAAKGIEADFADNLSALEILAKNNHVIRLDVQGREWLHSLYGTSGGDIKGVTRIDARGRIVYTVPHAGNVIGADVSKQDHIKEIFRTQKPVISDVFLPVQGAKAVAVHVPVFRNGTFDGTIGFLISFDQLAKRYLEDIRIGQDSYAWLINAQGTEIYCPVPGHTGNSVFENCKDYPDILAMARRMMSGEEGEATYAFNRIRGETIETVRKQAVFVPIKVGNTFWSIVVATPEEEVLASRKGLKNRLLIIIGIMFTAFICFAYFTARTAGVIKEQKKRREAEEALLRSAEEVRDLYDNAPCGYYSLDSEGRIIRINDTLLTWLGYERGEILGKNLAQILSPASREYFIEDFPVAKERGGIHDLPNDMIRKDGTVLPVLLSASIIHDEAGGYVMSRSIAVDMTARKKVEEELKRSLSILSATLESTADGILVVGRDGQKIFNYNRNFLKLWSVKETLFDPVTGALDDETLLAFVADQLEDPADFIEKVRYVYTRPEKESFDVLKFKDGRIFERYSKPQWMGDEIIGRVWSFRDVTERKHAEDALRASEEKYRNIIEKVEDGYFEVGLDGRFTFFNTALLDIFGYNGNELMHMDNREYATPDTAIMIHNVFSEMLRTGQPIKTIGYQAVRKDGEIRHLDVSCSPICDPSGMVIGFRGFARDVTERKSIEEEKERLMQQLQQARKLEAIGTLAGGIAHDFNNLLMGIQGYVSLMLLNMGPTNGHYNKLKAIEHQVQSGADLTKQLLGFARGGRYEVKPTNLNDMLGKTAAMFSRTRKEIRIFEEFAANPWYVDADQGQMEQVFLKLFVNAWQAMPTGGNLYLETKNVMLDESYVKPHDVEAGSYVKVCITDTGMGMDEKTRERIFDPFFTTKEMGRGAGLGLASVYGVVKGHKGIINVYSEKGHGTTFSICLPTSRKEEGGLGLGFEKKPANAPVTILIVDDEEIITDVTGELLRGLGYRVFIANSGKQAFDIYRDHGPDIDLVILDMIMPDMGGGEAFDRMKKINPAVKVILSSGYSMNELAKDIIESGARAFLQKPFLMDELSRSISEVLA
ncbi:MAG: Sensor histidine kinase RcsC [Syntrophus sp. SKADARSKE-3]|nr:Sensor histidine kinase RcsC [Syntrophus sp. SKADARSKE-3]